MRLRLLPLIALVAPLVSCVTPSQRASTTAPTTATEAREPAQASIDVLPETSVVDEQVANFLKNHEAYRTPVESMIRTSVALASTAQKLATSFDARLDQIMTSPANQDFYTVQSDLNCKLWDAYNLTEGAEQTLLQIQRKILSAKDQRAYNYLIGLLFANHLDPQADILTKAQLTRALASQHEELCGSLKSKSCVVFPKVTDPRKRPFDPFNDQEMLNYKKKNLSKIATNTGLDFGRGDCFADDDREPQQVGGSVVFDWVHRATSGYNLAPGTFAITYDDGPHKKFTPMLEQMWSASGLEKPTFFWLAGNVKPNLALAQMVRDHGYLIGSHSYIHADLGSMAKTTQASLMSRTNRTNPALPKYDATATGPAWDKWKDAFLTHEIVESTATVYSLLDLDKKGADGKPAYHQPESGEHLFRLPYGSGVKNPVVGEYFAKANVRHYFWTIDSLDWQDHNPLSVKERVEKQMQISKRGIILFHDIHPQSVEASRLLLADIKAKKTPVPVSLVKLPLNW